MTHFNRYRPHHRTPWGDPKYAYRNNAEYQRQRREALQISEAAAAEVERRWAARQNEKRKYADVAQNSKP